jgi:hypothetical protein
LLYSESQTVRAIAAAVLAVAVLSGCKRGPAPAPAVLPAPAPPPAAAAPAPAPASAATESVAGANVAYEQFTFSSGNRYRLDDKGQAVLWSHWKTQNRKPELLYVALVRYPPGDRSIGPLEGAGIVFDERGIATFTDGLVVDGKEVKIDYGFLAEKSRSVLRRESLGVGGHGFDVYYGGRLILIDFTPPKPVWAVVPVDVRQILADVDLQDPSVMGPKAISRLQSDALVKEFFK